MNADAPMTEPLLQVTDLRVQFGAHAVVSDVTF